MTCLQILNLIIKNDNLYILLSFLLLSLTSLVFIILSFINKTMEINKKIIYIIL